MRVGVSAFDERVFTAVNGIGQPWLDYLCGWPTHFGDPWAVSLAALAFMLIWDGGRVWRKFAVILMATLSGYFLAQIGKAIFHRPRPYVHFLDMVETGSVHINALFGPVVKESAFPSAHAATIFTFAVVMHRLYGTRVFYAVAAFVAFTRLYVGVHFPTDILAGALLGAGTGWMACRIAAGAGFLKETGPGGTGDFARSRPRRLLSSGTPWDTRRREASSGPLR